MAETALTEELELACCQLIAQVGNARSCFVTAVAHAEAGEFEAAEASMAEGDQSFKEGHDIHMSLLQREAQGEQLPFRIIMLHAEDLMAGAELLRIMAEKFIGLYRRMEAK